MLCLAKVTQEVTPMVATVYTPNARRDAAAREIAEGAGQWLRCTLRRDVGVFRAGTRFYGIPSSTGSGAIYYTNFRFCSCPAYESYDGACKHQRGVALHVQRVQRQRREQQGAAPFAPATLDPDGSRVYLARLEEEQRAATAALVALGIDPLNCPVWTERDHWIARLRSRHALQDRDAALRLVTTEQRLAVGVAAVLAAE
jgi:hypothetical protein